MSFNSLANFTKKKIWLSPSIIRRMMLTRYPNLVRVNMNRSFVAGCYYMRLVMLVMALLFFMAPAIAQSLPEPLKTADVIQYKRLIELQKNGNMKQAIREMG